MLPRSSFIFWLHSKSLQLFLSFNLVVGDFNSLPHKMWARSDAEEPFRHKVVCESWCNKSSEIWLQSYSRCFEWNQSWPWNPQSCSMWGVSINNSDGHLWNCSYDSSVGWPAEKNQFNQHCSRYKLMYVLFLFCTVHSEFIGQAIEGYKAASQRRRVKTVMFGDSAGPEVWRSGCEAFLTDTHCHLWLLVTQIETMQRHIQKCGGEIWFPY